MRHEYRLTNKVIVVIGTLRGLGCEHIKTFANENSKVIINYFKNEQLALDLYKEINTIEDNCLLVKGDVINPDDVIDMYHQKVRMYKRVDWNKLFSA